MTQRIKYAEKSPEIFTKFVEFLNPSPEASP